jgi:DNA replication and repair protein RecF
MRKNNELERGFDSVKTKSALTILQPSPATRIMRLSVQDFRCYTHFSFESDARMIALIGDNGIGKTNLLEALSLFSQGRGLRRADTMQMSRLNEDGQAAPRFSVAISLYHDESEHRLGVGGECDAFTGQAKRLYRIDGEKVTSSQEFSDYLRLIWLLPDMDGLFRGAAGDRRRFLDRLVLATDSTHGRRVQALERALSTRNRLLEDNGDPNWCSAVEREIAEHGVAVATARAETVSRLSALMQTTPQQNSAFPWAVLSLEGEMDALVSQHTALDAEDAYRAILSETRARDRGAGRTLFGPHTSDLNVIHGPKNVPAERASTGEQKALLTGLILAHARLTRQISGLSPILLLDEVAAHLDPSRRAALYHELTALDAQVWMTGTDHALFEALPNDALKVHLTNHT